jgi:hypothetical protein
MRLRVLLSLFMVDPTAEGVNIHDYVTQANLRAAEITFTDVKLVTDALPAAAPRSSRPRLNAYWMLLTLRSALKLSARWRPTGGPRNTGKPANSLGCRLAPLPGASQHRAWLHMFTAPNRRPMAILASIRMQSANAAEPPFRSRQSIGVCESARLVASKRCTARQVLGVTDELNIVSLFPKRPPIWRNLGDGLSSGYVERQLRWRRDAKQNHQSIVRWEVWLFDTEVSLIFRVANIYNTFL